MTDTFFVLGWVRFKYLIKVAQTYGATIIEAEPNVDGNISEIKNVRGHCKSTTLYLYDLPLHAIEVLVDRVTDLSGVPKYFYRQRYGTPNLVLSYICEKEDKGRIIAGHGSLAYYRYSYDIASNEKIHIDERLLGIHNKLTTEIKHFSRVISFSKTPKRAWIDRELVASNQYCNQWYEYIIDRS